MSYDCIVVGAGSAGAVVAHRLSEDPERSVLLLEAGDDWRSDDAPSVVRSFDFFEIIADGQFVWPGLEARLTPDRGPEPYVVGRGLGGGSTANGVIWARPPTADFDHWADLGCAGWGAEDVLPYFRRAESDELGDREYHGDSGPIPVWRPPREEQGAVDDALREAALAAGHPPAPDDDFNAPDSGGVATVPYNARDGDRVSTNDAYVEPARERENLTLVTDALVDRVRFEGTTATGVEALVDGERTTYDGEHVVLSAGAIHTPTILMRSGIGPAEAFAEQGIDARVSHESLGELMDHPLVMVSVPLAEDARRDGAEGPSGCVFLQWTAADRSEDVVRRENDVFVMAQNSNQTSETPLAEGKLVVGLGQTFSQGRVKLADVDPTETPEVHANLLSDHRDLTRLREGLKHALDLLDTGAFADVVAGDPVLGPSVERGRPLADLDTDAALDRAVRETCANYFHPVGTCRMGNPEDPATVVDPDGGVVGTERLHVADASVMPDMVRCNTNATAVMIGEHLAERFERAF